MMMRMITKNSAACSSLLDPTTTRHGEMEVKMNDDTSRDVEFVMVLLDNMGQCTDTE